MVLKALDAYFTLDLSTVRPNHTLARAQLKVSSRTDIYVEFSH
jgi:hypothetical protein